MDETDGPDGGVIARLMHPHQIAEQKHNLTDVTMRNPLTLPDGLKEGEDISGALFVCLSRRVSYVNKG